MAEGRAHGAAAFERAQAVEARLMQVEGRAAEAEAATARRLAELGSAAESAKAHALEAIAAERAAARQGEDEAAELAAAATARVAAEAAAARGSLQAQLAELGGRLVREAAEGRERQTESLQKVGLRLHACWEGVREARLELGDLMHTARPHGRTQPLGLRGGSRTPPRA